MKLHYNKEHGIWWAEASFAEKDVLKKAGFWWHDIKTCRRPASRCPACQSGIQKKWWTQDSVKALRLKSYGDEEVQKSLELTTQKIMASHESDSSLEIPVPEGKEYLPYQRAGVAYAVRNEKHTIIGDDMGLGKTVQALGVVNYDETIQNVLVISPAQLRLVWRNHARDWLVRDFNIYVVEDNSPVPDEANFVIINYDRLKGGKAHPCFWMLNLFSGRAMESIIQRKWDIIIMDEAHYLKNPKAQRTRYALGYWDKDTRESVPGILSKGKKALFLTGTPIVNRPVELHPILSKIDPDQFANFSSFGKRYCAGYQKVVRKDRFGKETYAWDYTGASNMEELQGKLRATCMIRRTKEQVLSELPDKVRSIVELPNDGMVSLIKKEQKLLEKHPKFRKAIKEKDYETVASLMEEGVPINFDELAEIRHLIAVKKAPLVINHVDEMLNEQNISKVVLFCWHRDVAKLFKKHWGNSARMIIGGMKNTDTEKAKKDFQTDPEVKVLIGNIKAAGTGHTLTAAHNVVFAELDWVPGNLDQAEDRCHRIGQEDTVFVQHLVIDGSLDAKMVETVIGKQKVIKRGIDGGTVESLQLMAPELEEPTPDNKVPKRKKYPEYPEERKVEIGRKLQQLAGVCDWASAQDGAGFNKFDASFGHELARKSQERLLTNGETHAGIKMLKKYHRQIGEI